MKRELILLGISAAAICLLTVVPRFEPTDQVPDETESLSTDRVERGARRLGLTEPETYDGRQGGAAEATSHGSAPLQPESLPSFSEVFDEIVQLYTATGAGPGTLERATFDLKVVALYETMRRFEDYGSLLLGRVQQAPGDSMALADQAAFRVCEHGLGLALTDHSRAKEATAIVDLAGGIISVMTYSSRHANLAPTLLLQDAYLHPSHEALLLQLSVEAQGDLSFLAGPLIRLLLHLWDTNGLNFNDRLGDLMALASGNDPAARAALVHLFNDERMRAEVIERIMALGDDPAIDQIAILASSYLPPEASTRFLEQVSEKGHDAAASGAYFFVAEKGLDELKASYVKVIQQEDMSLHRGGIVNAVGMSRSQDETAFVQQVFREDPSSTVRALAVQSLGSRGGADFERMFDSALEDGELRKYGTADILGSALLNYANGRSSSTSYTQSAVDRILGVANVSQTMTSELRSLL